MNKGSLATILGVALLGLAKKGSGAKMPLDEYFKKKAGNESQTFNIHFRVKYLPITVEEDEYEEDSSSWDDEEDEYEEDWVQFAIEYNFEDEINQFIKYIDGVAEHIRDCEESNPDYNFELNLNACINGDLEAFYVEWADENASFIDDSAGWKQKNIIAENSKIIIDFPKTAVGVEGVEVYAEPVEVKGYLEVKLNINTIGFNLSEFRDYIQAVIVYGYKKWIWDNPNIDYFDLSLDELLLAARTLEVTRVEPDIWEKKQSKLRRR